VAKSTRKDSLAMLSLAAVINQVKRKIQANEIREINGKPSQCGDSAEEEIK
jgi:hypothetical protein